MKTADPKINSLHEYEVKPALEYETSNNGECSFCEKKRHEVKIIFKGKYATICDECVELCVEIIEEELAEGNIQDSNKSPKPYCSFCLKSRIDPKVLLMVVNNEKQNATICDKCTTIFADELKFI
jgi:hypothetical protein